MPKNPKVVALKRKNSETASLTQRLVDSCAARQSEYFIRDPALKGFFLRVKPSGIKSYGVQARLSGKGRPIQRIIGTKDRYRLQEAKLKAKDWLRAINEGRDPKELDRSTTSPRDLLESYVRYRDLEATTVNGYRFNFRKYLAKLQDKPCKDITAEMVVSWYEKEKKEHPIAAERTFVTLKTVLRFGKTLRLIEEDVTEAAGVVIKRPRETKNIQKLEAIYKAFPEFLNAFLSADISNVMRDWIVLALTTGLRKEESMSLKWDQVFLEEKYFVVPKNKAKRYLIVPMIGITYDMFQSRFMNRKDGEPYVFNSGLGKPIRDPRKALKNISRLGGVRDFCPHDLRRIFASVCHELHLSEEEIAKLLNHSTKSVTDLYINRSVENVREKYRKVIDYMDRQIPFDSSEDSSTRIVSATNLMRAVFYRKVSPQPDPPISNAELAYDNHIEQEYWEG
jgi:integrase